MKSKMLIFIAVVTLGSNLLAMDSIKVVNDADEDVSVTVRTFSKWVFGPYRSTEKVRLDPNTVELKEHIIRAKESKSFARKKAVPTMKIELAHKDLDSPGTELSEDQLRHTNQITVQPEGVSFSVPSLSVLCGDKFDWGVDSETIECLPP